MSNDIIWARRVPGSNLFKANVPHKLVSARLLKNFKDFYPHFPGVDPVQYLDIMTRMKQYRYNVNPPYVTINIRGNLSIVKPLNRPDLWIRIDSGSLVKPLSGQFTYAESPYPGQVVRADKPDTRELLGEFSSDSPPRLDTPKAQEVSDGVDNNFEMIKSDKCRTNPGKAPFSDYGKKRVKKRQPLPLGDYRQDHMMGALRWLHPGDE